MTSERDDEPIPPPCHPPVLLPPTMYALSEKAEIHVGELPTIATDDALSEYFAKYGRVLKATVTKKMTQGMWKDYGFVWFADEESAKAALEDVEEHVFLGKKVEVNESDRKKRRSVKQGKTGCSNCNGGNPKKIFLGGLPPDLNEEELKSLFEKYGETTDVVVIVETVSRKSRGFGFVTFVSEESAKEVLRHKWYLIHGQEVEVKVAIPKKKTDSSGYPGRHSRGLYPSATNTNHWYPPAAINGYSYYHQNSLYEHPTPFLFGSPVAPAVPHNGFQPWLPMGGLHVGASRDYKSIKIHVEARRDFKRIKITEPPGGRHSSSASGAKGPSPAPAECTEKVQQLSTPGQNNTETGPSPVSEDCNNNIHGSPSGKSDGTSASPPSEDCVNDGNTS